MYTCFLHYHTVCKIRPSKSNAPVYLILSLANICPKHPGVLTQYKNATEVHDTIGVFKQVLYAIASDPLQQHLGSPVVPKATPAVPSTTSQAWGCGDSAAGGAPGSAVPVALLQTMITGLPSLSGNPASSTEEHWLPSSESDV